MYTHQDPSFWFNLYTGAPVQVTYHLYHYHPVPPPRGNGGGGPSGAGGGDGGDPPDDPPDDDDDSNSTASAPGPVQDMFPPLGLLANSV